MRVAYYDGEGKMFDGLLIEHFHAQAEVVDKKGKVTQEAKPERGTVVIVDKSVVDSLKVVRGESVVSTGVVLLEEVPKRDGEHPTGSYKEVV